MRAFVIILLIVISVIDLNAQERHWSSPDYLVLQSAGSIGYVSGGVGYDVFRKKARASFLFGHVPKSVGGPLNVLAGKLMFVPRRYHISDRVFVNPFDAGLMISYHVGSDFRSTWPSHQYPENYYWWKTSLRFHLNLESSVTFVIRDYTIFKTVTPYVEFNSNELYLVSFFQNRNALRVTDIIMIGAGARFHF
jgi:hypothetical protein